MSDPLFDCYTSDLMPATIEELSSTLAYKSAPTDARVVSQTSNEFSSSYSSPAKFDVTGDHKRTVNNPKSQCDVYRKRTLRIDAIGDHVEPLGGKRCRYSDDMLMMLSQNESGSNVNQSVDEQQGREWGRIDTSSVYKSKPSDEYFSYLSHLKDSSLKTLRTAQSRNAPEDTTIQSRVNEHCPDKPDERCANDLPANDWLEKKQLRFRSDVNDRSITSPASSLVTETCVPRQIRSLPMCNILSTEKNGIQPEKPRKLLHNPVDGSLEQASSEVVELLITKNVQPSFANRLAEQIMEDSNLNVVVQQLLANGKILDQVEEAMKRGTMFVMVVMLTDLQRPSATVFILDDNPEEHRYMNVGEAVTLIKRSHAVYMTRRQARQAIVTNSESAVPLSKQSSQESAGESSRNPLILDSGTRRLLCLLAADQFLTTSELDSIISYLQLRRRFNIDNDPDNLELVDRGSDADAVETDKCAVNTNENRNDGKVCSPSVSAKSFAEQSPVVSTDFVGESVSTVPANALCVSNLAVSSKSFDEPVQTVSAELLVMQNIDSSFNESFNNFDKPNLAATVKSLDETASAVPAKSLGEHVLTDSSDKILPAVSAKSLDNPDHAVCFESVGTSDFGTSSRSSSEQVSTSSVKSLDEPIAADSITSLSEKKFQFTVKAVSKPARLASGSVIFCEDDAEHSSVSSHKETTEHVDMQDTSHPALSLETVIDNFVAITSVQSLPNIPGRYTANTAAYLPEKSLNCPFLPRSVLRTGCLNKRPSVSTYVTHTGGRVATAAAHGISCHLPSTYVDGAVNCVPAASTTISTGRVFSAVCTSGIATFSSSAGSSLNNMPTNALNVVSSLATHLTVCERQSTAAASDTRALAPVAMSCQGSVSVGNQCQVAKLENSCCTYPSESQVTSSVFTSSSISVNSTRGAPPTSTNQLLTSVKTAGISVRSSLPAVITQASSIRPSLPAVITQASSIRPSLSAVTTQASSICPSLSAVTTQASSIRPSLSAVTTQASSVRPSLAAVTTQASSIRSSLSAVTTQASSVRPSLAAVTTQASSIRPSLSAVTTQASSIRPSLSALTTQASSIRPSLSVVTTQASSIRPSLSAVTTQASSIRPSLSAVTTQASSIRPSLSAVTTQASSVRQSLSAVTTQASSIRQSLSAVTTQASSIRPSLSAVTTQANVPVVINNTVVTSLFNCQSTSSTSSRSSPASCITSSNTLLVSSIAEMSTKVTTEGDKNALRTSFKTSTTSIIAESTKCATLAANNNLRVASANTANVASSASISSSSTECTPVSNKNVKKTSGNNSAACSNKKLSVRSTKRATLAVNNSADVQNICVNVSKLALCVPCEVSLCTLSVSEQQLPTSSANIPLVCSSATTYTVGSKGAAPLCLNPSVFALSTRGSTTLGSGNQVTKSIITSQTTHALNVASTLSVDNKHQPMKSTHTSTSCSSSSLVSGKNTTLVVDKNMRFTSTNTSVVCATPAISAVSIKGTVLMDEKNLRNTLATTSTVASNISISTMSYQGTTPVSNKNPPTSSPNTSKLTPSLSTCAVSSRDLASVGNTNPVSKSVFNSQSLSAKFARVATSPGNKNPPVTSANPSIDTSPNSTMSSASIKSIAPVKDKNQERASAKISTAGSIPSKSDMNNQDTAPVVNKSALNTATSTSMGHSKVSQSTTCPRMSAPVGSQNSVKPLMSVPGMETSVDVNSTAATVEVTTAVTTAASVCVETISKEEPSTVKSTSAPAVSVCIKANFVAGSAAVKSTSVARMSAAVNCNKLYFYEVVVHELDGSTFTYPVSVSLPPGCSGSAHLDVYCRERLLSPASFQRQMLRTACAPPTKKCRL